MAERSDEQAVMLAQAIKRLQDNWAAQIELSVLQAKIARIRYESLVKAGFTADEAILLCTQPITL